MADPITPENAPADDADRARLIKETMDTVIKLKADADVINARIRQVKQENIKGALGMKIGDFNAALRLYQLEDDDRAEFLATMKETFAALGIGEQLSMFSEDDDAGE